MKKLLLILLCLPMIGFGQQTAIELFHWDDTTLVGSWSYNNTYNECWGVVVNNREFAVIGSTAGTHIFDVSDPINSSEVAFIAGGYTGSGVIHRDYHDFQGYLYAVCDEGSSSTLQIIDISTLPDSVTIVYDSNALFTKSHNIYIDTATAKLYACASNNAMDVYDLNTPTAPILIYSYNGVGHVHDAFVRNDSAYLNCGNNGFRIMDFSNVNTMGDQPTLLGSLTSYPDAGYNHSGWLSDDGTIYAMQDENHGYDVKILDVSDFNNISVLAIFNSGVDPQSIPHNGIIKDDLLYLSYYHDGLRVFDISDPTNPVQTWEYDTYTPNNHISYRGAWGVYPYLPSGNIIVSDMQSGLFVLALGFNGCTDSLALNYDSSANTDDGSCFYCDISFNTPIYQNNTFNNTCDGFIIVTATSSAMPINYIWSNGVNGPNNLNLCTGLYSVTATDTNGCSITDTFTIGQLIYGCTDTAASNYDPNATVDDSSCYYCDVSIYLTAFQDPLPGYCNGLIITSVTSSLPVTYSWNTGSTSNILTSLCAGIYELTATDSLGCSVTATYFLGNIIYGCTDPLATNYDPNATVDDGSCQYSNGMCPDLFFSEYVEGSSQNKAIEIYNPTSMTVDLSNYQVERYSNGATNSSGGGVTVLTGMLAPGDVFVLTSGETDSLFQFGFIDPVLFSMGDMAEPVGSYPTPMHMNGNDAIVLIKNGSIVVDVIGKVGEDPYAGGWTDDVASGFTMGVPWTANHTLIRKNTVLSGDNNGLDLFNPSLEWDSLPNDTWNNLGSHTCNCLPFFAYGCIDPLATNYDPAATTDDGSCTYPPTCSEDSPTGLFTSNVIHNRATINWDNMNSTVCIVDQYRIQYREVGASSWSQKTMSGPVGSCNFASQKTDKLILNLTANTNYEYQMKAWYCGGGASSWSAIETFTTLDNCPNVGNLAVYGATPTKATFTWDASNGVYSFVRLKARIDSISNPTGADFFQIGGAGVSYGTFTKNKNGLTPSQTYRGQARTYCDPNGGGWKSLSWTPLVYWTQPTLRIEGGKAIANLAIYPNPSKDVFNITFTSERIQDLRVRVLNVVGEEIVKEELQQHIGEYTKQINLEDNAKGIYFLEIETNDGIINKKLVLQ